MKTTRQGCMVLASAVATVACGTASAASDAEITTLIKQLRDGATQTQASLALVDIGLPAVKPLLDGTCTKGLETWSRDTLLRLVMRARDKGGPVLDRSKIAALLVETVKKDKRAEARRASVRMLGLIGRDEAVSVVAAALRDKGLRADAIASLQQIPANSAAEALIGFAKSASASDRCSVLHSLGLRGCKASIKYLTASAQDKDANVQVAAVQGLGQAGDLSALPLVLAIAEKGASQVKPAAMEASLRLAEAALKAGKKDQALAAYDKAMGLATDPLNRIAAIAGYARVAGKDGTARLIGTLGKRGGEVDRQIMGELARMPGRDATLAIAQAYKAAAAGARAKLVTILGMRRDPAGFSTLIAAGKDADQNVQAAAMYAMAQTGQTSLAAAVLDALSKGAPKVQAAAADAYTVIAQRLLSEDRARNEPKVLAAYHDLLGRKLERSTKIAALDGIALIASPTSAAAVEKLLTADDARLRTAAARAYIAIANKMNIKKDGPKALAMYNRVIDLGALPASEMHTVLVRLMALGGKADLADRLGMITQWWVIGAWPSKDYDAFDKPFFPEKEVNLTKAYKEGKRTLKWKPVATKHREGRVDLLPHVKRKTNAVAYGYAEVTSDRDQDVVFRTGSDDGMKLWVNGKVVFGKNGPRSLAVDMDTIPVKLKKGVNKVLIKVLNGGGGWEFCARVTTKDGRPLKLKVRPAK